MSATEASNVVFLIALLLRPDVFGISIALAARGAVKRYWRRMPERIRPETASDVSWLCVALAANLEAGLDWLRSVRIVAQLEQIALAEELVAVAQRLEWGLDPQDAFLGVAPELEPLAHAIEQTRRSGAPISDVLRSHSNRIRTDVHTSACERVEKLGASAVVPVAALQIPSFVILGLVPFVATQLGPMLSVFSSTGL
jgi:pilus assembly protein TadC